MNDISLTEQFSLIVLNSQNSRVLTKSKKIALKSISILVILELYLNKKLIKTEEDLLLTKEMINKESNYRKAILSLIMEDNQSLNGDLIWWIKKASNLSNEALKKIEEYMISFLKDIYLIEEIPGILGCDINYNDSGVRIKEYRSNTKEYSKIVEDIHKEILDNKDITYEIISILWLLKENGSLHDIFSNNELEIISSKINNLIKINPFAKTLFSISICNKVELIIPKILDFKNSVFHSNKNTQSIFIETEEAFSNSIQRLASIEKRLLESGHEYTVIKGGEIPLIKIDNIIYEAIPSTMVVKVAIQGVRLKRYYI